MVDNDVVAEMLGEAVEVLRATGQDLEALLELVGEVAVRQPVAVAHALGVIEGAAVALGVTATELLDEFGLLSPPASTELR